MIKKVWRGKWREIIPNLKWGLQRAEEPRANAMDNWFSDCWTQRDMALSTVGWYERAQLILDREPVRGWHLAGGNGLHTRDFVSVTYVKS